MLSTKAKVDKTLQDLQNSSYPMKAKFNNCFIFNYVIKLNTIAGYTALHRAASWGHTDCLRVLVTNGADLQIRNAHGERAREAAARYKKDNCVDYLDRAGTLRHFKLKLCYDKLCLHPGTF